METSQAQSEIPQATANEYDPFLRGPYPAGVRTFQANDTARNRLFPCELWYPAAEQHAGQDLALETQDVFTVPLGGKQRRQMALREAQVRPGAYPLVSSRIRAARIAAQPRFCVLTWQAMAMLWRRWTIPKGPLRN